MENKINKVVIYLLMVILVSVTVSAYYGGTSIYYDFSNYDNIENISYEYVGGQFNYDGLEMSIYSSSATLHIPINYCEDNFGIVFEIVTKEEDNECSGGSSGGSSSVTITKIEYVDVDVECESSWECSGWSNCFNKTQKRECILLKNECNKTAESPIIIKNCIEKNISIENSTIVTNIIEDKKDFEFNKIFIGAFLILIIILVIVIYIVYGDTIKKFRIFKAFSKYQKL